MRASDLREQARFHLRGNWPTAVLCALTAGILGGAMDNFPENSVRLTLSIGNFRDPTTLTAMLPAISPGTRYVLAQTFGLSAAMLTLFVFAAMIAGLILGGAINVGYCRYLLNLNDGTDPRFSDLFSQLHRFGSALCLHVLHMLIVFAGFLCLIVPGIILAYGLRLSYLIMADDPDCSAVDALMTSWSLMKGHKLELFLLELSFLGWALLAALVPVVGSLFFLPYLSSTEAAFYRRLSPKAHWDANGWRAAE